VLLHHGTPPRGMLATYRNKIVLHEQGNRQAVVYLLVADKYNGPVPCLLHVVSQPVMSSSIGGQDLVQPLCLLADEPRPLRPTIFMAAHYLQGLWLRP
jgi:hypothetical protein